MTDTGHLGITPDKAKEFIEKMDDLAREKPAGFTAYIATCMSSMKMADFSKTEEK